MSLFAIVHLMANTYGWNIEYIMNMTMRQIKSITQGAAEVNKLNAEDTSSKYKAKDKINDTGDLLKLAMMPGVKMKKGTRKKFLDAVEKMKEKGKSDA